MKVKQLRDELAKLDKSFDDKNVIIWLPGSRIDLRNNIMNILTDGYVVKIISLEPDGSIMIEGNIREGSALNDA